MRFDPQNLKADVSCYRLTGESIGDAKCIGLTGFDDTEAARHHARLKQQNLKAHKVILANERRMGTRELVELLPAQPATPELLKSKVVRLTPRLSIAAPPAVNINAQRNDGDWRWNHYQSLKARPTQTLDADERAAIRIYESTGRISHPHARNRGGEGVMRPIWLSDCIITISLTKHLIGLWRAGLRRRRRPICFLFRRRWSGKKYVFEVGSGGASSAADCNAPDFDHAVDARRIGPQCAWLERR